MTTYVVCAVRDAALQAYMQPFFTPTSGAGIRAFMDEVKRKDSPMGSHPADYELFDLGTYNDADGSFTMYPQPRPLMTATRALEV